MLSFVVHCVWKMWCISLFVFGEHGIKRTISHSDITCVTMVRGFNLIYELLIYFYRRFVR